MKSTYKIAFLICGFVCGLNSMILSTRADGVTGPHGGQIIQNDGQRYEVVHHLREHQIQVYAPHRSASEQPSSITVKIKKNDAIIDRVHLSLMPDEDPNNASYVGKVPANISISGGITFDIDF